MRYTRHNWEKLMGETLELLMLRPHTVPALAEALGEEETIVKAAISRLRHKLAVDNVNIICHPVGPRQPWMFYVVGSVQDARAWREFRTKSLHSQIATLRDVATSMDNATPRFSMDGREAHAVSRQLARLLEDLEEIRQEYQPIDAND